jgi:hypothetical protein
MNWNIEQLSNRKLGVAGMPTAIARTVAAAQVDILLVLEVKKKQVGNAMTALSLALNAADGGGNNWLGYFLSRSTGGEYYCAFIRDLDQVRPVFPQPGVGPVGHEGDPLVNLKRNTFQIWPSADWATTAYPVPGGNPLIPLCDLFASRPRARQAKRSNFGGQTVGNGGYSLGRGYRMPALALFWVHTPAPHDYLLPFVLCHYAAVRGRRQRNILGQSQVFQLMFLHIAQLFNSDAFGAGTSGYLDVMTGVPAAHTAVQVQELCFTGDFNLDFLQNNAAGNHLQKTNRSAYDGLTPTPEQGGSLVPAALPGAAGPVPAVPYGPPWQVPPSTSTINQQRLKAGVTTQGTIQQRFPLPAPLPVIPPAPYGASAFDNFIYGGTQMSGAVPQVGNDSGESLDVPAAIVAGAAGAGQIDLRTVAQQYALWGTKNAGAAPNLQGGALAGPLSQDDRLVGSRLLSDHLPVVLDFNLP